ncbi:hypothetical protein K1719_044613 [Acacia pycnantha]|nr:hypothetical protein K1719_044613 [Acacia pycnantha]
MVLSTFSLVSHPPTISLSPAKIRLSNSNAPTLRLSSPLSLKFLSTRNTFTRILSSSPTQNHIYPDPVPEFAESETQKFRAELFERLSEDKDEFGEDLHAVVHVCAQIFSDFMHKEYGGPGTLLVEPFTDMLIALKKKKLPGAPLAARTSLLWAQNYVDHDWQVWNSKL